MHVKNILCTGQHVCPNQNNLLQWQQLPELWITISNSSFIHSTWSESPFIQFFFHYKLIEKYVSITKTLITQGTEGRTFFFAKVKNTGDCSEIEITMKIDGICLNAF